MKMTRENTFCILAAMIISGCASTPIIINESVDGSSEYGYNMMPVMAPEPDDGPTTIKIVNETRNYHSRCWIDNMEVASRMPPAPVKTSNGQHQPAQLIPPGGYAKIGNLHPREHHLRCHLYVLMKKFDKGGYFEYFEVSHERVFAGFRVDEFPDRIYHINDDEVWKSDRI